MANEPERMVPARYIGTNKIHRNKLQGPGFTIDGTRRDTLRIEQGDMLMMPEREILGQSYLFDPHGVNPPLDLGAGKRVLPEHVGKSDEELAALGYEFHAGRPDFELVVPQEATAQTQAAQDTSTPVAPEQANMQNGG